MGVRVPPPAPGPQAYPSTTCILSSAFKLTLMKAPSRAPRSARSLVKRLSALRPVRDCRQGMLSWEISSGCRFWASLGVSSMTHIPLVGICLPAVMEMVDQLLCRAGMPATEAIDRNCSPVFSLPLDALLKIYRPELLTSIPDFRLLHVHATLDDDTAQEMVESILRAEAILVEVAGTPQAFVDWSQANFPHHPGLEYALPVACHLLGRHADAHECVAQHRSRIQAMGNGGYSDFYERYIEEVKREFGGNE